MDSPRTSRRTFFGALAIGAGGLGAGTLIGRSTGDGRSEEIDPTAAGAPSGETGTDAAQAPSTVVEAGGQPIPATGAHQAGTATPANPQPFAITAVFDLPDSDDLDYLAGLGDRLLELLADDDVETGDLTVTFGIGPDAVAAVDPALEGAQPLPAFAGDHELSDERTGGDLLMIASASEPAVLPTVIDTLAAAVRGAAERWRQFGFRGPGRDGVVRNPFGFHDGIIVPRGDEEMTEHVWLDDDPRTAGGTIAVIRRLRMDTTGFGALSRADQEAAVGRRRTDGAPLSGGGQLDEISLTAKTPEGEFVTPSRSHARAAHPGLTGSALMLRRGYAYADGDETGLVFTCFQRDLRSFVITQQRLDEEDEMMRFVTTTASASFLILPGFDAERPLGSTLRAG